MTAATASTAFPAPSAHASSLYAAGEFGQSEDTGGFRLPRYWPSELLAEFTLQMSARGECVNASMMLGSREYAIEKLSHAHTLGDDTLRELAVQMFSYFDDEPFHAVTQLVSGPFSH